MLMTKGQQLCRNDRRQANRTAEESVRVVLMKRGHKKTLTGGERAAKQQEFPPPPLNRGIYPGLYLMQDQKMPIRNGATIHKHTAPTIAHGSLSSLQIIHLDERHIVYGQAESLYLTLISESPPVSPPKTWAASWVRR